MITVRPNRNRASSLLKMAERRLEDLKNYPKYKQVEEYWDAAKEAILAMLYCRGLHTTSHRELVEWLRKERVIDSRDASVLDMLRKARNGISYYGEREMEAILDRHDIDGIVRRLVETARKHVRPIQ